MLVALYFPFWGSAPRINSWQFTQTAHICSWLLVCSNRYFSISTSWLVWTTGYLVWYQFFLFQGVLQLVMNNLVDNSIFISWVCWKIYNKIYDCPVKLKYWSQSCPWWNCNSTMSDCSPPCSQTQGIYLIDDQISQLH